MQPFGNSVQVRRVTLKKSQSVETDIDPDTDSTEAIDEQEDEHDKVRNKSSLHFKAPIFINCSWQASSLLAKGYNRHTLSSKYADRNH